MRAVVQRVSQGQVVVEGEVTGSVGQGVLVLLGVKAGDVEADADYLARKIYGLRIFKDDAGKMNLSTQDIGGGALVVSQFTLYGDCRKGRRPSYNHAAPPEEANRLYLYFCEALKALGCPVETGRFQRTMSVSLINEGPVTLLLDSEKQI